MPTGLAGLYAQKALKIPTVITYNGRDVPGPGVPPLWKYWHRFIGLNCRDMTFVSKYCREVIYGPKSQIGHIIYNGVEDPASVSEVQLKILRSKLQLDNETLVLLSLQRLDYLKRVDVVIRAMPEIVAHKPQTRLVIGGKGPDLDRLRKLASDLHLADRVVFTGFIPDDEIPVYYALADLFVFHSTYETFGIVLAEAMNYGKAIVSAANTAIQEVVDEGKTGLLVPTFDHNAVAKAVLQLLNNRLRREEMGKQGKRKVESFFRWDTIALEYERVLTAAVQSS
jgi:glycosyltransferase involved in cell wall biosynthesis